jgi:fused signal recognition particle receptor
MTRLFRTRIEKRKSIWRHAVDLALTDVGVLSGGMDHETLGSLEERLLAADFGVQATLRLVDAVESRARRGQLRGGKELREALEEEVGKILESTRGAGLRMADSGPTVWLVVGVNGVGKTTTIAKLAHRLRQDGKSVLVAAADTYRAGAVEQLRVWAERVGAEFVGGREGGDPAAVAYDAISAADVRGVDVVLVDTAGRLHTNRNLMEELEKVARVIARRLDGAPHETLIVLDATIGQNAINQVRAFGQAVSLTGILLTKLDSTARGGIVVALQEELHLPVTWVGTGEGMEDLEPFDPEGFTAVVFEDR